MKRAGCRDFRFHDPRHTFASNVMRAGANLLVLKELLGHRTLVITQRYTHPFPEQGREAVARLADLLGTHLAPAADREVSK